MQVSVNSLLLFKNLFHPYKKYPILLHNYIITTHISSRICFRIRSIDIVHTNLLSLFRQSSRLQTRKFLGCCPIREISVSRIQNTLPCPEMLFNDYTIADTTTPFSIAILALLIYNRDSTDPI